MTESQIQTKLIPFIQENPSFDTGAYELKLVKNKRFDFNQIYPHQLENLKRVKLGKFSYKIPDPSKAAIMKGEKRPFDFFVMKRQPAWVAICFWENRKSKMVYFIDIETFINYKDTCEFKSMHEHDCKKIATFIIDMLEKPSKRRYPESEREIISENVEVPIVSL